MIWFFEMLRVKQYYKNFIIFLVLLFVPFSYKDLGILILGFIALCLMSSTNYIINDLKDKEKDKLDKIKRKRPFASGKVKPITGIIFAILFFILSLTIAFYLNTNFGFLLILFFILTQLYTFWLKHKIFLDIIMIAINFMIRAIAGAFILNVYISAWFISGIFFLAMFLVFAKRYGEALDNLEHHRKTLKFYTKELMSIFLVVFMSILILLYSLYIILNHDSYLFVATIPLFTFLLLRYFSLIYVNSDLARHMEKVILRKDLLLLGIFFILLFLIAIYI